MYYAEHTSSTPTDDEYDDFASLLYDYGPAHFCLADLKYRIENLKIAKEFWKTIPSNQVVEGLTGWGSMGSCGSIACFGGHLAKAGMFGIKYELDSFYPILGETESGGVAEWLFGRNLFLYARQDECFNGSERYSSHEVVTHRIDEQLELLEDVLRNKERECISSTNS